ncbi:ABC transporter permease [Phenylobacterium sp.]|uniref:ABC transporter permease n=1 Tax=Phenylobacterium sp. TaxID=1871053 RepID=UPI0025EC9288|nr:ABC transporter permease [Phenylobacterium sp.]MBX3482733.1 ABC transporter permease [Phenylobacterium sp.]MCW5759649.1 ABC transporter permease [Phenylobacterium sp.]
MDTATHMLRTGRRGALFQLQMAARDLRNSFARIGLAWSLATHDVASRYRGSVLGPFWITLSMGLMVLGIGFLYASLFKLPVNEFLPYVALGIVFFGVMTGTINEGCDTFVQASGMLSQTALPMFTFVWRTVFRNLINLAHHLVIVVGMLAFYGTWKVANPFLALIGIVLMLVNASWISLLAGIASARYRDIPQIVVSIMQFAIFMTPVFWLPSRFGEHQIYLDLNPFYHLLQAVRGPLLGQPVLPATYVVLVSMAVVGWLATFLIFARTRRRIVHYL